MRVNFIGNLFMEEDMSLFLEQGGKTKNLWWKNLKGFSDNAKSHLDYFKQRVNQHHLGLRKFEKATTLATAKTCPAIGNALLNNTIVIKCPFDCFFSIEPDGRYFYDFPCEGIKLTTHHNAQLYSEKHNPFEGYAVIKWELPIVVDADKQPYIFLEPQYESNRTPFKVLNGVIEKDNRLQLNVNTLIKLPKEQEVYHIKEGTHLAYIWTPKYSKIQYDKKLRLHVRKYLYIRSK